MFICDVIQLRSFSAANCIFGWRYWFGALGYMCEWKRSGALTRQDKMHSDFVLQLSQLDLQL